MATIAGVLRAAMALIEFEWTSAEDNGIAEGYVYAACDEIYIGRKGGSPCVPKSDPKACYFSLLGAVVTADTENLHPETYWADYLAEYIEDEDLNLVPHDAAISALKRMIEDNPE